MKSTLLAGWVVLNAVAMPGCRPGSDHDLRAREAAAASADAMGMAPPRRQGSLSLEEALRRRRSVRAFTRDSLTHAEIAQLLWAAQGVTDPEGYRTAPSAGALYPLECYVAMRSGVYHYEVAQHRLRRVTTTDVRPRLAAAAHSQSAVEEAPVVFAITALYERTTRKYGVKRGERYAILEAGHAAQNLLLQAVALDLGAVPIGAFSDAGVADALQLERGLTPLYLVPVGRPRR